jgi:hypothetical protein
MPRREYGERRSKQVAAGNYLMKVLPRSSATAFAQLGLGIHDNRTVPRNRLIARLARHQQEALECRLICPMMS